MRFSLSNTMNTINKNKIIYSFDSRAFFASPLGLRMRALLLARLSDHGLGGLLAAGLHDGFEAQVIEVVCGHYHIDH